MKKKYESPIAEKLEIGLVDIIAASDEVTDEVVYDPDDSGTNLPIIPF